MSPADVTALLESAFHDVLQDSQHSSELSGAIARAAHVARKELKQIECTHPGEPIRGAHYTRCAACGKILQTGLR